MKGLLRHRRNLSSCPSYALETISPSHSRHPLSPTSFRLPHPFADASQSSVVQRPLHSQVESLKHTTTLERETGEIDARKQTIDAMLYLVRKQAQKGFQPSAELIVAHVQRVGLDAGPETIQLAEKILGAPSEEWAWIAAIQRSLAEEDWGRAVDVYDEAVSLFGASLRLARDVFRCRRYNLGRQGRTLGDIYQELLSSHQNGRSNDPHLWDRHFYEDFLYSMATPVINETYQTVLDVLLGMRKEGTHLANAGVLMLALMKPCRTYEMMDCIFTHFSHLGVLQDHASLHEAVSLFHARKPDQLYPPPAMFFGLVRTMAKVGHVTKQAAYHQYFNILRWSTVLVDWGSRSAVAQNPNEKLLSDLRIAHALFRKTPSVVPDTQLLNILMDAYSRCGSFAEAISVWREHLSAGLPINERSISIILDTCGHGGHAPTAFEIWQHLREAERRDPASRISAKTWETWIECLCRLDKFDEVLRVLVFELGSPRQPRPEGIPPWRICATGFMVQIPLAWRWKHAPLIKRGRLLTIAQGYGLDIDGTERFALRNPRVVRRKKDDSS